jgi:hypothetical protein
MFGHVGRIVAAVGLPVTADLEAGYGDTAEDVGRTVARVMELGAAGCNLEDARKGRLFGIDEALDRLAAARAAAPSGTFVLNARTDTYFAGTSGDAFAETVERATRYLETGADCVFVPGVVEEDTIRRLAAAIPGPLNVVAGLANLIDAPPCSPSASSGLAWAAAWPEPHSPCWNAPVGNCSTPEPSASRTVRLRTPTCSDASVRDRVPCNPSKTGRAAHPECVLSLLAPLGEPSSVVARIRVTGSPASAGLFAGVDQTRVRRVSRKALASGAESKSRSAMT